MPQPDYFQITEAPGLLATHEQLERIYHRYHFAKPFTIGKKILEIACGTGIGLRYLTQHAQSITGGDIDDYNLAIAKKNHAGISNIYIEKMDAHQLPFPDESFDLVLLYEAIYYLKDPEKFIKESYRVLRKNGMIIICTVNCSWRDFHPSPFTHNYFSIPDLQVLLSSQFNSVKMYGAFKIKQGISATLFSLLKHLAVTMGLIPGSLRLRAYLKRIFIGKTFPLPVSVSENMTDYLPPVELDGMKKDDTVKIVYGVGRK